MLKNNYFCYSRSHNHFTLNKISTLIPAIHSYHSWIGIVKNTFSDSMLFLPTVMLLKKKKNGTLHAISHKNHLRSCGSFGRYSGSNNNMRNVPAIVIPMIQRIIYRIVCSIQHLLYIILPQNISNSKGFA